MWSLWSNCGVFFRQYQLHVSSWISIQSRLKNLRFGDCKLIWKHSFFKNFAFLFCIFLIKQPSQYIQFPLKFFILIHDKTLLFLRAPHVIRKSTDTLISTWGAPYPEEVPFLWLIFLLSLHVFLKSLSFIS